MLDESVSLGRSCLEVHVMDFCLEAVGKKPEREKNYIHFRVQKHVTRNTVSS